MIEFTSKKCYDKNIKYGKGYNMGNIYDGAFRTLLNDCRKLIIPVINEIFDESYTGEEEIRFFPNEHFGPAG